MTHKRVLRRFDSIKLCLLACDYRIATEGFKVQGNSILDMYEVDDDGDYVIDGYYIYNVIICGGAYYPDTTETYDGVTEILFDGLDDYQGKIFALCVEGWV